MGTLKLCGTIVVPSVTHALDYRSVFRDEEMKGAFTRWECFRLQVESAFRLISKAPSTVIDRWELTTMLSAQELLAELQTMTAVQSWQLHHLLRPRDNLGMLQPSLIRKLRRGLVLMRVTEDDSVLPIVDVSLPNHGDSNTMPLILKLATHQSGFYAGLSLFSIRVKS